MIRILKIIGYVIIAYILLNVLVYTITSLLIM